ncbi:hypothetical protein Q5H92_25210 [Hymenobacter sp. M29]|uniref:ATP-binding protein n=1 Tax=Hymenobacter mellowenesis TaxID=3063995 RepID=A0ABT9AIK3_9BACT|nr:hypothetical protein [Hymenobacter sp. M29]MDO7849687.1 hypothetical protein [Hymenobacter sp. M29]
MIKPEASRIHFDVRPDEQVLARHLEEAFDVTHGAHLGGGRSIWVIDPKPQVRERFGLQLEVLALYSPHKITDARTLTAIDQTLRDPDYKHRIDNVLFLLIHAGDVEATKILAKSDVDKIIIPIHVDELLNPARGSVFLRQKIASHTGEVDLFGKSSPISSDKYFFGRDDLVQTLIARITSHHETGGLFGLRKTGKTSVLKAIQRRVADRAIIAEYMDCSNPGVHSARWWDLLEEIVGRLSQEIKRREGKDQRARLNYTQSNAGLRFSSDIKLLIGDSSTEQVILIFDEIEYITPNIAGALGQHWDDDFVPFWQSIRSVHQELDGKLSFIVAGVNPACVQEPRIGETPNPIFQLAQPEFLAPFNTKAIREMVRTLGKYAGLKFDEDVYQYLQSSYGGHPFLTRIACSEVWRATDRTSVIESTRVTIADFEKRKPEIRARLSQPIRDILLSLVWWYPEEYELLQILASGDDDFFRDYLANSTTSVVRFAQYGILSSDLDGQFAIADLRDFLNKYGEEYKKSISNFMRGDMPPELLPEVPDLDVLADLFKKKCDVEIQLRQAIIIYLGILCNWDNGKIAEHMGKALTGKRERTNPEHLFIGRRPQDVINELFTVDLKSIIIHNWSTFAPLFESNKSRFEMNMDTINRARRVDAHTKPVSKKEAEEFNNSYQWMLNRLSKVPSFSK